MKLLEFFHKLEKPIKEGGNITLPTGETPDDLDLTVTKRGYIVPILDKLLSDIDRLYQEQHKEALWSPKLLTNKQFLSGSSLHFFNVSGISDEDFVKVKPKIGDIDTQIDVEKTDKLKAFLDSIQGQDLGDAKLLGYKSGNQQYSSLWELKEPPIKMQIDLEFVDYEKDEPTEWSQFSHSSAWEDVQEGIKGVFHKFLISSIGSLSRKDFLLRKMVGRGKARAEQDVPTTDNMLSFAVSSKEGGGLRPKYEPVLDDSGQPLIKDGLPVMTALPTSGYEKNILSIFQTLFGDRVGAKELSAMKNKLWSFVGLLDVMNMMLDDQEKQRVFDSFAEKLYGKGAQGLYKNDPERDSADKNSAINKLSKVTGISLPAEIEQMKKDYYAGYKMTGESITEAEVPNYKRQGIKHIYNPGSSTEISDRDFVTLVRKIKQDLGGKLKGAKINLKVDGAGIRFGKDESGRPFMMTSRADKPLYADDVGSFAEFNKDRDAEFQERGAKYDRALDTIVNSDFIKVLPNDTIVQAEMLYNEMAEKTDGGLKFVNIPYDPKKLGGKMTLVPFMAKVYSTGESHPQEEEILDSLAKKSSKEIKLMSNTLPTKDIDINKIIDPAVNLSSELEATLAPRTKDTPEKQQAKEILASVKKELSDFIANNPNISGKDQLGPNMEGLVIELPGLPPVKVTSQEMKSAMAAKKAPPAGSENQPTKTAVVALGSFVGHRGHQQLYDFVAQEAAAQKGDPFVFISQAVGKDDPIPGDMKLQTWQKLYPGDKDVFSLVADQPDGTRGSLIKKVEHELVKPKPGQLPDYNNIIIMVGSDRAGMEKQAAHLQNRLNKFPGYENVKITLKTTPREAGAGGTGVNFTAMRAVLRDPNATEEQQLKTWLSGFDGKILGDEWIKKLMDAARQNMGIAAPEKPVESLDEQFEMVWREYLTEAISPEEAVRSIVSTADSITKVYGDLKTMAEKWVYNNGSLKGFHRNAAGLSKRWYDAFFWNKMDNDLRLLMTKNPKAAGKLKDFFNIERDDKGHVSFTTIGRSLPRILNHVGEQMNNKDLKRFAAEWFRKHKDYKDYLGRVEAEVNDEEDDFTPAPKQPKDNVVGRQNAAAEDVVNQILRSIDKKAAGEIRNAIAREPNKLQALQRELARRNIKVGESLDEVFDMFGPVGNLEMAVTLLAVLSMPLAIIGPEVFDRIKNKIQKMSSRRIINLLSQKQIKADTATKKIIERLLYELQQSFDRNDGDKAKQIALRIKQIAKDTEDKKSVAADPIDKFKVGETVSKGIGTDKFLIQELKVRPGATHDQVYKGWNLRYQIKPKEGSQEYKGLAQHPTSKQTKPIELSGNSQEEVLQKLKDAIDSSKGSNQIPQTGNVTIFFNSTLASDVIGHGDEIFADILISNDRPMLLLSAEDQGGMYRATDRSPSHQKDREGHIGMQAFAMPAKEAIKNGLTLARYALGKADRDYMPGVTAIPLEFRSEVYPGEVIRMNEPGLTVSPPRKGQTIGEAPIEMDEDWRKKLAALGIAGMMGASGTAGAADRDTETNTEPIVATIVIDGEVKKLNLTPKGFTDVRDAEKWIAKFMKDRGIMDWQGKIERGEPGTGRYQRVTITGAGGLESIQEAPIEMDPSDPMDPMIYGHDKANPGKLKYRMARAAGQLKDLAARVDGAGPSDWQRMAQQFEELKMNMEQIRHALEELGKVRKKGGIRSRGITV